MSDMSITYSAPAVDITLKIIESYGIDTAALMKKLKIDPACILKPNARFDYRKIDQLWYEAVQIARDDAFGLRAAQFWHPSHLGALGYAWLASSSLRTALQRLARYMSILTEGACLRLKETPGELHAVLEYRSISMQQPTRTDSFMAMLLAMCRANCGENFTPLRIELKHAPPADSAPFEELFACPVCFEAGQNAFIVATAVADRRLVSANPRLAQISDQITVETLAKLQKDNIVARTRAEILHQLATGNVSDKSVASELHLSERSLQRKLAQEGASFKQLLNVTRKDLAIKYIEDGSYQLTEIAFMLGYNEYSSFSRAFRRWTGQSPRAYAAGAGRQDGENG